MTLDEALELIKKYNACNNEKPKECFSKKCAECEHKYDEKEWYQMFNQIAAWLEELKELREYFNTKEIGTYRYNKGRADAIDEFKIDIINKINFEDKWLFACKSNNADTNIAFGSLRTFVENRAEQLKEKTE